MVHRRVLVAALLSLLLSVSLYGAGLVGYDAYQFPVWTCASSYDVKVERRTQPYDVLASETLYPYQLNESQGVATQSLANLKSQFSGTPSVQVVVYPFGEAECPAGDNHQDQSTVAILD